MKSSLKSLSANQTTSLKCKTFNRNLWYDNEKKENIIIYLWNLIILTSVPKPVGQS